MSLAESFNGLSETAHETIVDLHGESQQDRVIGYLSTQSLRTVMEQLDSADVIEAKGRRRVRASKSDVSAHTFTDAEPFVTHYEQTREEVQLNFERDRRGQFPWESIKQGLDESGDLYDIPLCRLAFKFTDDRLYEHLWEHIQETLANHGLTRLSDSSVFSQPFVAVMESSPVETRAVRDSVKRTHDERYWLDGDQTDDDGRRGLGWTPRTLDLTAIWTRRSYSDARQKIGRTADGAVTLRDVEEAIFNRVADDEPVYGAVNSKLAVNKWRSALDRQLTDMKRYEWRQTRGWVPASGGVADA